MKMLSTTALDCPAYLLKKAVKLPAANTAIINAGSELPLKSAKLATEHGLISPVLIGDQKKIAEICEQLQWDISGYPLLSAKGEIESAQAGVSLAKNGEVSLLMKGDVHTDHLLQAALHKTEGIRSGRRLSHVFHMSVPGSDDVLYISDAVINVLPDLRTKKDILGNALELMRAIGVKQPKVAVLSATEQRTRAMPSSVDADEIQREAAKGSFGDDLAVSRRAAQIKGVDSMVSGQPDLLLVPNIEAGNILFKQMVYFMSAAAAGIVLGAKTPILLTSRADPVGARLASIALGTIYTNNR